MNDDLHDRSGIGDHGATVTALRDLFAEDAAAVEVTADAWSRFEAARADQPRIRVLRTRRPSVIPLTAIAVAATIAVLVGVLIRSPESAVETRSPATEAPPTTTPTGPPVSTVEAVPGTTDPPPTTSVPAATTDASVRAIDLYDATYPADVCPGVHSSTIIMRDGVGGDPDIDGPGEAQRGAYLRRDPGVISYGDVNSDGVEDVAVIIDCAWHRTDDHTAAVAVMTVRDGRFVPLTTIVDPHIGQFETLHRVDDDRSPVVEFTGPIAYLVASHVEVAGGTLAVTWETYVIGGVNRQVTATYRVTPGGYERVALGETLVTSGQGHLVQETERYAVRSLDLRSMTLPLGAGGICTTELGPGGSVPDVQLTDGRSAVRDANGGEVGAVELVDVRYGPTPALDWTYEDPSGGSFSIVTDEALVRLRCTGPSGSRVTVLVIGERDGSPAFLGELVSGEPAITGYDLEGASAESAVVIDSPVALPGYNHAIEVVWRKPGAGYEGADLGFWNRYRWNGSSWDRFY